MNRNLCKTVIENGGTITPLIIPSEDTKGLGLMNPSILIDGDRILVNLRSINYTLYHSEGGQRFIQRWGPLSYLNPENDVKLKTNNFICILSDKLEIEKHFKVDTSRLDIDPLWEFHGLEDARLVKWKDKLYLCGVRRDVKPNGEGRMELSEIVINDDSCKEVSRFRIPDPNHDDTAYCNKNWVPVLDMPYHFVKWTNPTELIKVDPIDKTCKTIIAKDYRIPYEFDFRGGSQVFTWGNYRLSLIHETCVFKNKLGQKDAIYKHRFIVWDKEWNIVRVSEEFSFMTAMIEFSCGMAFYKGDLLITFGFQDNAAYLLRVPEEIIESIIGISKTSIPFQWGDINNFKELKKDISNEVLFYDLYQKFFKVKENDIVVDVGSSVGPFAYKILSSKPKVVYCFEPRKSLYDILESNFKDNDTIVCINKGITLSDGEDRFDYLLEPNMNDRPWTSDTASSITFTTFIKEYDIVWIDFLKCDCEGGEYSIFTQENYYWIIQCVGKMAIEFHLLDDNHKQQFKIFREIYLRNIENYRLIFNNKYDITQEVFEDDFINKYGYFMMYINFTK